MGIRSISSNSCPLPKLRVTAHKTRPLAPQLTHGSSDGIGGDKKEFAAESDLDDRLGRRAVKRDAADNAFDFTTLPVALTLRNFAREDNVFEVEDAEVVIV